MLLRHLHRVRDGGEIHPLVPLAQQPLVYLESLQGPFVRLGQGLLQYIPHVAHSIPRFWATSSTDTSAGETPEILEAWPTFTGFTPFSFCRASSRSPDRVL